jgi:glutathione S-transferase
MAQPTGPTATSGIELFTWGTPNGWKASILLEELKDAYGTTYTTTPVDISTNVQKDPWFIAINPNGRIPAILDHDHNGLSVFEGNAILSYLSRRYDKDNLFSFAVDEDDYTRAEAWIGWQHGGVGPMQGQAGHFLRAAKEDSPWGIQRYVGETERLYGILDTHLAKDENKGYVVGGRYSIADIALVGWVALGPIVTIDVESQFPHIWAWLNRLWERPAVQRGFNIPKAPFFGIPMAGLTDEQKAATAELKKRVDAAKEKFDYKYVSP